ncbi:MAG: IS1595 family transposase [Terriglobales bacterium]
MEPDRQPVPGVDFPVTFGQFEEWFATEAACRRYLAQLRWPSGFVCPRCQACSATWTTSRGLWHCQACQGQTSVTAGTVFEGTRKPLRAWFLAMWFVTSQKHGASALGLQRVLGLGSYQTAWAWLHKLRRAMVRPGRDRLSGDVEVDETYVGGPEEGVAGRQTESKSIVAIAAEVRGKATGRIRMRRVPDVSGESLLPFVQEAVAPGARVRTDGWGGYGGLRTLGYRHKPKVIRGGRRTASEVMPRVHKVASLLKRWLLGTLHGGVQPPHLDYYLDEFTFRFNRRTSRSRGQLFYRLVQQAVATDPVPYRSLVGGEGRPDHNR